MRAEQSLACITLDLRRASFLVVFCSVLSCFSLSRYPVACCACDRFWPGVSPRRYRCNCVASVPSLLETSFGYRRPLHRPSIDLRLTFTCNPQHQQTQHLSSCVQRTDQRSLSTLNSSSTAYSIIRPSDWKYLDLVIYHLSRRQQCYFDSVLQSNTTTPPSRSRYSAYRCVTTTANHHTRTHRIY